MSILIALLLLVQLVTLGQAQYREDGQCGPEFLADNGQPALCDNIPPFPTWFVKICDTCNCFKQLFEG